MSVSVGQKQQLASFILLLGVTYVVVHMLASASTEHTLIYVIGTIGCILAFLNAEVAVYFLIVAMLLSPEVAMGEKTTGASLGRAVTLRIDDFILLIISATWFIKSVLYKEISLLKRTPLNGAMYLYMFAAVFSTMLGVLNGNVDPKSGGLFVLKYIEYFLVYWMVVNTVVEEGQIRRFVLVTIMVAVIVCLVSMAQIPSGARVSAPFEGDSGEPNTLGGYLLLMISVLGAFVLVDNKYRWVAAALVVLCLIPFTYTLSRASYAGLIPVFFILPILTRRYYLLIGAMVLGLLVSAFAAELLPKVMYDRISFTFNQAPQTRSQQVKIAGLDRALDTSTSARLLYMQAAIDAFFEKPILGWGVTGWHFLDSQYFRTLSETGLFGFATLLYLIVRVLQMAFHSIKETRDRDPFAFALSVGFFAGTVGLLVHAIGSNTFIIVRIMEPFWLLCALVYLLPIVTTPAVPVPVQQRAA